MSENNYFSELEKIANNAIMVEDIHEPMVDDPQPQIPEDEVEVTQALNSEPPSSEGAEEQLPPSPEETEELTNAIAEAEAELAEAKEVLASKQEEYNTLEKLAAELSEELPAYGALAKLVEYSTATSEEDAEIIKLAQERLVQAFQSEDDYQEVIEKTASELFESKENTEYLYSEGGVNFVIEQLASFSENEELEKEAFQTNGIVNNVRQKAGEYATKASEFMKARLNFHQLSDEIQAANVEISKLQQDALTKERALNAAKEANLPETEVANLRHNFLSASNQLNDAQIGVADKESLMNQGKAMVGGAAVTGAGGAWLAGKKMHDAVNEDEEEELSVKTAGDTMKQEEMIDNEKGGYTNMSRITEDFLKIAGAAVLLDIANDENQGEEMRKEAAHQFNSIARLGRKEMEESFVKVATELFTEDQLHEVVAGKHNEALFDKIAFFTDAYDMSADELEKVAGADGVATKGVAGALTDAKKNVEEHIDKDKAKTETVANGETGSKDADDKRGYNVTNNPGEYDVDKTAATKALLEEAEMQKVAAYRLYVEADTFIKNNTK